MYNIIKNTLKLAAGVATFSSVTYAAYNAQQTGPYNPLISPKFAPHGDNDASSPKQERQIPPSLHANDQHPQAPYISLEEGQQPQAEVTTSTPQKNHVGEVNDTPVLALSTTTTVQGNEPSTTELKSIDITYAENNDQNNLANPSKGQGRVADTLFLTGVLLFGSYHLIKYFKGN